MAHKLKITQFNTIQKVRKLTYQDLSEFPGCVGRVATGAVAEANYYNVRQSYRTFTNYRVSYRCLGSSSIINYEKCESSHPITTSNSISVNPLSLFIIYFPSFYIGPLLLVMFNYPHTA